ncbi:sulfurtransferase TusA family protein [Calidifontibacillus oryziterrae]|uniref:sulfurtransferase TusA family protein n=1 Tax=Calidifontibacillus oryziterrae TaxID=1191699 RepID=UPI0002F52D6F|nr:sulfurtransferase TusA family protein [Calidifontibacillus oryziterrae]
MNIVQPVKTLNCKDYKCPLPQVQAKEALEQIGELEILEILTTDEDAEKELKKWTSQTGDTYLSSNQKEDYVAHYIQKAPQTVRQEAKKHPKVVLNHDLKENVIDGKSFILIDVREEIEFFISHIPGALNIPLGEVKDHLCKLDKEMTYAVICRTGNRSDFACQLLAESGFQHVYNVLPGMSEWDGELSD